MEKQNIFQGNELIQKQIAKSLGYEIDETQTELQRSFSLSTITEDIYFESFFYLSQRFGAHQKYDNSKDGGLWNFKVKNYDIQLRLNTSWLIVMIFSDTHENKLSKQNFGNYSRRTPFRMAQWRQSKRKRALLIDTMTDTYTDDEIKIMNKLYPAFCNENGIDLQISSEDFNANHSNKWFDYVEKYNDSIINVNKADYEKYGYNYQNSKTRHALRTLDQFLKNMLVPFYIRDCYFNIKGRVEDSDIEKCNRYADNIKIEFEKTPSQK